MLVGAFNKISDYSQDLFIHPHYRFKTFLSSVDKLAVCGLGFGDKRINSGIINWFYEKSGRCVVVIHPDSKGLISRHARGAITTKWESWMNSGCIRMIKKRVQELGKEPGIDELVNSLTSMS